MVQRVDPSLGVLPQPRRLRRWHLADGH